MPNTAAHKSAFTLIELVLVMLVIAITMAMAAPSLSNWGRGGRLRDAGDQFLSVARYARTQAIAEARVYRLNVDPQTNTYFLTAQDGQQFVEIGGSFGKRFTLPDGCRIAMQPLQAIAAASPTANATNTSVPPAQPGTACDFYPNGRTQPVHVRIANSETGDAVDISCPTPAEQFALGAPAEAPR
jgi:prepilin-type N-terminal cleavage/methylation domain-containing protein